VLDVSVSPLFIHGGSSNEPRYLQYKYPVPSLVN
jgi:hypothetical protein